LVGAALSDGFIAMAHAATDEGLRGWRLERVDASDSSFAGAAFEKSEHLTFVQFANQDSALRRTPVVMIAGFTRPNACNSCWNDRAHRFDHKDFLYDPRLKDTPLQFECTRLTTVNTSRRLSSAFRNSRRISNRIHNTRARH
jgi:hypothetical protein